MFVTRECDYAIRVVRELADFKRKTVKDICDQEHIPLQYAYKILKKLEKSGIVKGFRGTKGGYCLSKDPVELTLYDVLIAIEGDFFINECLKDDFDCPNNQPGHFCKVHQELCRLQAALCDGLREKNMAQILSE